MSRVVGSWENVATWSTGSVAWVLSIWMYLEFSQANDRWLPNYISGHASMRNGACELLFRIYDYGSVKSTLDIDLNRALMRCFYAPHTPHLFMFLLCSYWTL